MLKRAYKVNWTYAKEINNLFCTCVFIIFHSPRREAAKSEKKDKKSKKSKEKDGKKDKDKDRKRKKQKKDKHHKSRRDDSSSSSDDHSDSDSGSEGRRRGAKRPKDNEGPSQQVRRQYP